ncbi:S41 family peptidase [Arsukibacterium sp.]|uniref:S41 family peptidase n=1 Tax=Arsukibacterium sp. TaxID=1977258 RepID=UPI00299CF614|nr:S41 family peptidase [Arsukibacterium sp.]MDX1539178.1 S41 family peptidase [Arsukibacterium sp.]
MKGLLFSLGLLGCSFAALATPQNMDFSEVSDNLPAHWQIAGTEPPTLSKVASLDNATAIKISRNSTTDGAFADIHQQIKFPYGGKSIIISGYIKTTEVSADGFAGFWLAQASENDDTIHYADMELNAINGSNDWQQYTLSAELDPDTAHLYFGLLQVGNGSSEYAKLSLTIDGKPLAQAPAREHVVYQAALPHKFEQDSGIRLTAIDQQQHANLAALAKVWGFIKYYHPESAAGNISMDAELFKLIPKVLKADAKKRDQLLVKWINDLGELSTCKNCKDSTNAALAHPEQHWLAWQLSPELNVVLANVYAAELPARHFWVKRSAQGNPMFNEKPYADISYLDSGYRLLSVFRLWNIVHYYSPYRDLTEQPWQQVLDEAIANVIAASDDTQYQLALMTLISDIHDTHTQFWPNRKNTAIADYLGRNVVPVEVRYVEDKPVIGLLYQPDLALQVGDIITHIDGKNIAERLAKIKPIAAASNGPTLQRQWADSLLRSNTQQLTLGINRAGKSLNVEVPLIEYDSLKRQFLYNPASDDAYKQLPDNIGYIRLDKIKGVDLKQMMQQLNDTKGLIIDIRETPSELVVFTLGSYLYPNSYPFAKYTVMQPENPGQFNWDDPIIVGNDNPDYYTGKIAILINEQTQSSAEYTTMAFRGAPKAKVIGSTTAGADGNFSGIILPGGHWTAISGIGVFYPDGTPTQRIGIVPDIEVKPTIAGIAAGRDEQLEAAIEYIKQQ